MVYGSGPSNSMSLGVSRAPINGERRICPSPMSVMCVTPASRLLTKAASGVLSAFNSLRQILGTSVALLVPPGATNPHYS